jgi:hypothetical protein
MDRGVADADPRLINLVILIADGIDYRVDISKDAAVHDLRQSVLQRL